MMFVLLQKKFYNQGKHRINSRTSMAQRDEIIHRTVYVSDIDLQVTFRAFSLLQGYLSDIIYIFLNFLFCNLAMDSLMSYRT